MSGARFTLEQINRFSREEFARVFGGVFENSAWIADAAWACRPFHDFDALHNAFCEQVRRAPEGRQLDLIRAHPDLVGKATLTAESHREQAQAGLGQLSASEIALFQKYNSDYREKFGFPFVICARLNKKDAILAGFERRMNHAVGEERKTALEEIFKIAELRLRDLLIL